MRLFIATATALSLIAVQAEAALTGEISIDGSDVLSFSPPAMAFTGLGNVGGTGGDFTVVPNCTACVTMIATLNATSTGTLFSAVSAGQTASLAITPGTLQATLTTNPNPALDAVEVTGNGTIDLNGVTSPGSFVVTSQGPTGAAVTFSATSVPTGGPPAIPEPSGLAVLGAGLIGLGAWRLKRDV